MQMCFATVLQMGYVDHAVLPIKHLQDVPRDWLADLTTSQAQAAAGLSDGAALLRRV